MHLAAVPKKNGAAPSKEQRMGRRTSGIAGTTRRLLSNDCLQVIVPRFAAFFSCRGCRHIIGSRDVDLFVRWYVRGEVFARLGDPLQLPTMGDESLLFVEPTAAGFLPIGAGRESDTPVKGGSDKADASSDSIAISFVSYVSFASKR